MPAPSLGGVEIVVRLGQLVARHRPRQIRRDDDDELGLVADEVPAAEQRAENRDLRKAGEADIAWRTSSRTRPAIIIEPPDGSSMVVSARRLRIDSAVMPAG